MRFWKKRSAFSTKRLFNQFDLTPTSSETVVSELNGRSWGFRRKIVETTGLEARDDLAIELDGTVQGVVDPTARRDVLERVRRIKSDLRVHAVGEEGLEYLVTRDRALILLIAEDLGVVQCLGVVRVADVGPQFEGVDWLIVHLWR